MCSWSFVLSEFIIAWSSANISSFSASGSGLASFVINQVNMENRNLDHKLYNVPLPTPLRPLNTVEHVLIEHGFLENIVFPLPIFSLFLLKIYSFLEQNSKIQHGFFDLRAIAHQLKDTSSREVKQILRE